MNADQVKHKANLMNVHQEFLDYCYVMQYEYDYFRELDRYTEVDWDGNEYYVYVMP